MYSVCCPPSPLYPSPPPPPTNMGQVSSPYTAGTQTSVPTKKKKKIEKRHLNRLISYHLKCFVLTQCSCNHNGTFPFTLINKVMLNFSAFFSQNMIETTFYYVHISYWFLLRYHKYESQANRMMRKRFGAKFEMQIFFKLIIHPRFHSATCVIH